MAWIINDKEFASVLALPADKKYAYFLKRVADWEEIWSLADENGWALAADNDGREVVPIWPHQRYAAACAVGAWQDLEPQAIPLNEWIDDWLPGIIDDSRLVVVFPGPVERGIVVSPERLRDDLKGALSEYE